MKQHEQRVVDEFNELSERLDKLVEFIGGDLFKTLSVDEQFLLSKQRDEMSMYAETLECRISLFVK